MTEKPRLTPDVDGGISDANLKSFISFSKIKQNLQNTFLNTHCSVFL